MALVAGDNPPEVVQPGEQPFEFPPTPIAPQCATIRRRVAPRRPMGRDPHDAVLHLQARIQPIAVVGAIADHAVHRGARHKHVQCAFHQRHFMRRSTRDPDGDRKTIAVCNGHDLGPRRRRRRDGSR